MPKSEEEQDEIEISIRRVLTHIFRRENRVPLDVKDLTEAQEKRMEQDVQVLLLICNRAKEVGYSDSLQSAYDEPVQEKPWTMESEER